MSAITIDRTGTRDGFLRLALRADATCSGLMGIAGIPLAGWLADTSGTTKAFEYSVSAFFIAFAVGVFVLADVFPLTATGVVATLAVGVYTLVMAELQYQGWRRAKA